MAGSGFEDAIKNHIKPLGAGVEPQRSSLGKKSNTMTKNRMLVTLPLAIVLALPAFAQQGSSSAQPAATDQTAPASPSQNVGASGKEPLQPMTHEGFWGRVNPFARKKYVQRQVQPIQDRVNELDELTASNTKMIKDVDGRAQQGIQLASNKANEADQHALDAGNKAQMAQQTATAASTRLSTVETVVGNIDQYKAATQTEIRFRPGQSVLSKKAKDALDEMATPLKDQHGYIVEVQGFSSGRGQAAIATSQKMADSVVRYLVLNHEIPVYRIYVVGMGNAPVAAEDGSKAKRTSGGRVEISLLKNDLEQLAATTSAPAATDTTAPTTAPANQDQPVKP
jgi:outer membrane protein OmpA-like peptidoglycan-associated protein